MSEPHATLISHHCSNSLVFKFLVGMDCGIFALMIHHKVNFIFLKNFTYLV